MVCNLLYSVGSFTKLTKHTYTDYYERIVAEGALNQTEAEDLYRDMT